jgi:hypothetical protein
MYTLTLKAQLIPLIPQVRKVSLRSLNFQYFCSRYAGMRSAVSEKENEDSRRCIYPQNKTENLINRLFFFPFSFFLKISFFLCITFSRSILFVTINKWS